MPTSVVESRERHDRVRSYLKGALPDCQLTSRSLVSGYPPLLLMSMKRLMAAFAFSTGDAETSYDQLYGSFKDYYGENRKQLDALDLSFVFCVRPDFSDFHAFCSQVETDTYFCRKFVVPVAEHVEESFGRLPFLPLGLAIQGSRRPPSAQTYLRQCGVPAVLARYLSVPHQRGPGNIVSDCLDERSSWAPVLASHGAGSAAVDDAEIDVERVRLKSLSIRSFRAYKKASDFEFGAGVTVLYGPNGFGKTSLFDAIDFVATGGIGRLGLSPTKDRFAKVVAHLDGEVKDAAVSLTFSAKGSEHTLGRRVTSRMHPSLNGSISDRKTTLVKLTGGGLVPADRIEHLVTLFRATHLFSQENQELGRGFDRDCALPAPIVSHMLAFEDYASARSKASAVCEILQDSIARKAEGVAGLAQEIEEAEGALSSLGTTVGGDFESTMPLDALATLRSRVQEAGLPVGAERLDQRYVRACRSAIQARFKQTQGKIGGLTVLIDQVRAFPSVASGLAKLLKRRSRLETDLRSASATLLEAQDALASANLRVNELVGKRREVTTYAALLRWARVEQPRYADFGRREQRAAQSASEAATALDELRELRAAGLSELRSKEEERAGLATLVAASRAMVSELEALARTADTLGGVPEHIRQLYDNIARSLERVERVEREETKISGELGEGRAKQRRLAQEIERIDQAQSELGQLLSRIQAHIDQASCPLCGHDHGSAEDLRGHIEEHRDQDVTAGLRIELAHVRQDSEASQNQVRGLQETAIKESRAIDQWLTERAEWEARLEAFDEAATSVGIAARRSPTVIEDIRTRQSQEQREMDQMHLVNQTVQEELRQTRSSVADIEQRIEGLETALTEAQHEIVACRDEIAQLGQDSRADQLSLSTTWEELIELDERHTEQVMEIESAFSIAADEAMQKRESANIWGQRVDSLESKIDVIGREIGTRREIVAETTTRLSEHGVAADAGEEVIVGLLEEETRRQGRLVELGHFADSVEMAMDTATTAAAFQQQRATIREKRRMIEETTADMETHEEWLRYFADVTERVAATQDGAIARFATEYGPMASAIQQRLRCVYGFHGVDTRSHEATIRVRVKRGRQMLRPTDYFSHSQQQTLLLGLFLTASMSQTWSALSTVLLDDPVTHFDDLNTYAFLDMIVGLLSGGSEQRQFIISTCDQKVFHLARSKLGYLGRDARFYEFLAIGEDGPVVKEVAAG